MPYSGVEDIWKSRGGRGGWLLLMVCFNVKKKKEEIWQVPHFLLRPPRSTSLPCPISPLTPNAWPRQHPTLTSLHPVTVGKWRRWKKKKESIWDP